MPEGPLAESGKFEVRPPADELICQGRVCSFAPFSLTFTIETAGNSKVYLPLVPR